MSNQGFLPLNMKEALARGWDEMDFVLVTGDAYVDHPSFGTALVARLLESDGFRVGIIAQPDVTRCESMMTFGRPRYGFMVASGNIDSMVAHYTVSKKKRSYDYYTPGGVMGKRPDRATIVYCNRIREAYGDVPIIIGGLEASLRRFAHYDYWDDCVRPSILQDSTADILVYGMGEKHIVEIANRLNSGEPISALTDILGTCYAVKTSEFSHVAGSRECPSFEAVKEKASFITPVPGGVGAVTTSVLMKHVVEAAEKA